MRWQIVPLRKANVSSVILFSAIVNESSFFTRGLWKHFYAKSEEVGRSCWGLARFWHHSIHYLKMELTMDQEKMLKRISELESMNDQLLTEIRYLDQLLKQVGFEEGLKTLKFAANE